VILRELSAIGSAGAELLHLLREGNHRHLRWKAAKGEPAAAECLEACGVMLTGRVCPSSPQGAITLLA